ncbi:ABC transporter ATP-binding protein [Demequina capsici]|uniref:ATP-binding cassette domain-containing protein n=1 Tax=Demequina capsici TaxID=3075620 RepID=A0AA96J7L1_9MICO|nr:ATP-binding cassette domain-containing protein [Demequina sp. OYTSA14]WNM25302.1 ATP-binding cassette domain-containing protein [Demequina sp. OYTSA14]
MIRPSQEMDRVALAAWSISKSFGDVQALSGVSIDIQPGRIHALIGENGAGKSTLAKILAGIQPADRGQLLLNDREVEVRDRAHAKSMGINMVPQQLSLVHDLSLVDNLLLSSHGLPARRGQARDLLRATLDSAGVHVDVDIPTGRLGLAHRQLGEIVVALAEGARVLILDEPTASLGPHEVGGLFAHLRALCELGAAILLITHRIDEVGSVADDVTVLSHGLQVFSGPTEGLDSARIAQLMVGDLPPARERAPRAPGAEVLVLDAVSAASRSDSDLHDVSLTVHAGEVVGVAGVAGSGQHLLAEVAVGLEAPLAGSVRIAGREGLDAVTALAAGVAWIPESRADAVVPGMSVGANLTVYGAAVARDASARVAARFGGARGAATTVQEQVLRAFDVRPPRPALAAGMLSGGNQQKLLVARELDTAWEGGEGPTLVVANGPTQGMDLRASQAIRDRLVAAAERGAGVLVASHDLDELVEISDRIVVLVGGRLVDDMPAASATSDRIGRAMAGLSTADVQDGDDA